MPASAPPNHPARPPPAHSAPPDSNQNTQSSRRALPKYPLPAHESEFSTGARQSHCSPASAQSNPPPCPRSKFQTASPKPAHRKNPRSPCHPAKCKIPAAWHPRAKCAAPRWAHPQSRHPKPAARVSQDPPKAAAAFPPARFDPPPPPKRSSRSPSRPWTSQLRASANSRRCCSSEPCSCDKRSIRWCSPRRLINPISTATDRIPSVIFKFRGIISHPQFRRGSQATIPVAASPEWYARRSPSSTRPSPAGNSNPRPRRSKPPPQSPEPPPSAARAPRIAWTSPATLEISAPAPLAVRPPADGCPPNKAAALLPTRSGRYWAHWVEARHSPQCSPAHSPDQQQSPKSRPRSDLKIDKNKPAPRPTVPWTKRANL